MMKTNKGAPIMTDQPNPSPLEWLGYYHNTDATVLPSNCLTFPSINCFIPQRDKIVPRKGKTLLGQAFTADKSWPIIGHKERFTTMGGDTVEVRVTQGEATSNSDTIEILYNNPLTKIPTWYPLVFNRQSYLIGETFGGGKIAYILKVGDPGYDPLYIKGLIVSSSNISAAVYWHATAGTATGATATALGTGQANTTTIITAYGVEVNAAKTADSYTSGIYSDWYLPSKDELNTIYLNRIAIGGLGSDVLWSSSEYNATDAYVQRMSDGLLGNVAKNSPQPVRAIRSFSVAINSGNSISKGLHRYYMDDWFDTNLNPSISLNAPRLIWTNGNPEIYSWIGGVAPILYISGTSLTIDFGTINYTGLVSGPFTDGETITGNLSGASGKYMASSSSAGLAKILNPTGPFIKGETITGGTSSATATVLSYLAPKTWASLGFIDPIITGETSKISINGNEYISISGYNTPTLVVNSSSPTISVGDVAFTEIRSDAVDVPLDVCKNNKNYMFYGSWNSRRLFMSNNFNHDASQNITLSQAAQNDLIFRGSYTGTGSHVYRIQVSATGTPDTVTIYLDGVNIGSSILSVSSIDVIPGIIFITQYSTGHTKGDFWEITVNQSVSGAWFNFYYTLPVRKPGEGYIYQLPSNFWAMAPQEEEMYVNNQYGTWSVVGTVLSADLQSESVSLQPLKQSSISKVIYPYMITHLDNDLIFVTENKTLDMIGRREYLELPQIGYLSQPVDIDFKNATFTDGSMQYWDKKLWITSPKESAMFVFDNQAGNKYWQPPQVYAENGILSLINNTLISHSNIRNQTFQLFTGESDDGGSYTVRARTPYNSYGNRWAKKNSNKSFFEGYVSGAPLMKFTVYQGVNGCGGIFSHDVQPVICVSPTRAPLGEGNLGSHQFGSDTYENDLSHFNEIYPRFNPILEYYFAALEAECTSTNHSYIWLSMALNEIPSNRNNLELITPEVISRT